MAQPHLNVLIVDDMEINVDLLAAIIEEMGYEPLRSQSVEEALAMMERTLPQLILLDVSMPGKDGYELITILKKNPVTREIPVIFISALDSMKDKLRGLELGAADFITKPFETTEVTMRVKNHMETYRMKKELESFNHRLHGLLDKQTQKLENEKKEILCSLARLAAEKHGTPPAHLKNVGHNSRLLAQSLQLLALSETEISEEYIDTIEIAAQLHDLGRLCEAPDDEPRTHTAVGVKILETLLHNEQHSLFREMALDIIRYHHTDWNNDRINSQINSRINNQLPLAARILRIANDFDNFIGAALSAVPTADPRQEGLAKIRQGSGTAYDPQLAEIFIKIRRQLYF